ncbi:hypothetical protein N7540_011149 [Penicillium herquei]|nr:hypothetical protein N7540_011149 [Penicillium herquei]
MDLHDAAWQGNVFEIESAVEEGGNINSGDKNDRTPLWLSVKSGHPDACRKLILLGACVEQGILELAVQEGQTEIVKLLWPHCGEIIHYHCLETAISLGFHDIADFLAETGAFDSQYCHDKDFPMLNPEGFSGWSISTIQQWERFIFVRRLENLQLYCVFFNFALLLASKADCDAGLRLVNLLLEGDDPLADANCTIRIEGDIETPLTAAAEHGNLEVLAVLIQRPGISLTTCGKYGWPAFLHLLASPQSIATERGRAIAHMLAKEPFHDSFLNDGRAANLESVFKTVLRFGDDSLVQQVVHLVLGAGGTLILPLLIRVNDTNGLRWILNSDIVHTSKTPPILWVLLCDCLHYNPSSAALKPFIRVAEFMVGQGIWDQMVLKCLNSCNFRFAKQFFYSPDKIPPGEVAADTLAGFSQASIDQFLVKEWADKGFANAAIWSTVQSGQWMNAEFKNLLACSYVDPDMPFQGSQKPCAGQAQKLPSNSSGISTGEKRKLQSPSTEPFSHLAMVCGTRQNHALQDYQMQLMLLEQQNKRRLMMARVEQAGMATNKDYSTWTMGKSPLAWAAANRKTQLVKFLLRTSRVNVNSQDNQKQTPLMHAIAVNDRTTVERLLKTEEIDLNILDDVGRTAIFYAVQKGDLHVTRLLTETQKVNLSIHDDSGESVLDFARKFGNQDIIAALAIQLD